MAQRWDQMLLDYAIETLESALAAFHLGVAFQPLFEMLCNCKPARWHSNALFESDQQLIHVPLGVTLAAPDRLEVTSGLPSGPLPVYIWVCHDCLPFALM